MNSLALWTVRRRSVIVRVGVPGVQGRQEGSLLVVVIRHPPKDAVEDSDCVVDIRPLVEHHAFGLFAQCGITDLRPGVTTLHLEGVWIKNLTITTGSAGKSDGGARHQLNHSTTALHFDSGSGVAWIHTDDHALSADPQVQVQTTVVDR